MIPPIASRFVAGETAAEALEHVEALNDRNVRGILNLLGEHYRERGPADADAEAYCDLVGDVRDADVDACVSVKPTQIGLGVDEDAFVENLGAVVAVAAEADVFVWIDMEDHATTDATLDAYERFVTEYGGGLGVCVQANLRRTRADLERLAPHPGAVRIVKGAYDEPGDLAYRDRATVTERYLEDLEYAFREFEGVVAVGSHDPTVVERAVELGETYGTPFEFQMLMGVREDAQFELAERYDVSQYVPFGGNWFSYFARRATERRENLAFALRAVLGR